MLCLLGQVVGQRTTGKAKRDPGKEYALKAQMIKKMLNYVSWPKKTLVRGKTVLRIGILGRDPFAGRLRKALAGYKVHGCTVQVVALGSWPRPTKRKQKQVSKPKLPAGLTSCHALFVASSESTVLAQVLKKVRRLPIWLVADAPGFGRRGIHINFKIVGTKIRFETNPGAARSAGVSMSSKLLRLGTRVGSR